MALNDPPIRLNLFDWNSKINNNEVESTDLLELYDFYQYSKQGYYCIDGFPTEGMPGVVVVPAPYRGDYVYQALKPAVIVLCDDNLEDENIFK